MDDLPRGSWPQRPLGAICDRVATRNRGGNSNVLTISAEAGLIRQEEYFKRIVASQDLSTYFVLRRGDFAYNKSYSDGYPVGAIRRLDRYPSGVVSPLYICFRPAARDVDSDYLRHYFAAGRADAAIAFLAKEGARNHGLLNVGLGDFFGIPVDVPPVMEQRRIAETLNTADDAIQRTTRTIAKLRMLQRGIMQDLLTCGIDSAGKLRRPGEHPEQFKDTRLGRMPVAWEVVELGQVASVFNGATPSRARAAYWTDGTVPWLSSGKVNDYRITSPSRLITARAVEETSLRIVPAGALVVGMIGEGRTRGMTARLEIAATINQNLAAVVPRAGMNAVFGHALLHSQYERLRRGGRGSNQDALNCSLVSQFPVALPPLEEQLRIAEVALQTEATLEREVESVSKLRKLRTGLMEDLLSGRVRVPFQRDTA
jgi:type I restriction enzyme S subunit